MREDKLVPKALYIHMAQRRFIVLYTNMAALTSCIRSGGKRKKKGVKEGKYVTIGEGSESSGGLRREKGRHPFSP